MFRVFVGNGIDYSASGTFQDSLSAFLWAVGQLRGPCRSGRADIYKVD